MPPLDDLRLFLPIATALIALLVLGVAALFYLADGRRRATQSWSDALAHYAAVSPWRGRDVLLVILAMAAAQVIRHFLPERVWLDVLCFQGVGVAVVLALAVRKKQPFGAPITCGTALWQAALRWLALLPILWFSAFMWQGLLQLLGHATELQTAVQIFLETHDPRQQLLFFALGVGLAPLAEELFFRGLLLPLLVRRWGPLPGLLVSALLFAVLHADLGSLPALAIFAVGLTLACARTGSLWVAVLMHALFNAANMALLLALVRAGVLNSP